jgi:cell division protease FtsH
MAGPERKSRVITESEKNIVAYHEIGHALVAKSLPNADPVHKVSIISRGMALGYTLQLPEEDKYLVSKEQLKDRITIYLGGRVAEEVMFGDITSGAGDDIRRVTDIARKMVTELGMSEKLGPRAFGQREEMVFLGRDLGEQRNYSEEVAGEIDEEVHTIVATAYSRAKQILTERKEDLIKLAEHLKEVETMDGGDIDRIISGEPPLSTGLAASVPVKDDDKAKDSEKKGPAEGGEGRKRPLRPEPFPS